MLSNFFLINLSAQTLTDAELYAPIYSINYSTNKWELNDINITFLDDYVIDKIKKNKNSKFIIYLEGHTDDVGTEINNLELSKKRVRAVADYLISKGISTDQIHISYFGETKPVTRKIAISKKLKDIRYANRRVEIRIEKVF